MTFDQILDQAIEMLQRRGRLTYRTLKRQFDLDDEALVDLKEELLYSHPVRDDAGRGLVWTGDPPASPDPTSTASGQPGVTQSSQSTRVESPPPEPPTPDAERRQLTVMFCDLVGSTPLSEQLDPEDLREVVLAYQQTCAEVIQRFEGHIAQLLGDALLVYFGWPHAHEDDAQRAVRTGLGMLEAMRALNARLEMEKGVHLAIRVGIHTGLVVVGEMGGGGHQEQLALGETPNVASRIQGLAEPDTVAISGTTYRLVEGYVTCQALGEQTLKGVSHPMPAYHVLGVSGAHSRLDIVGLRGFTPLVGREHEVTLLLDRWHQARDGQGHMILLSGEAGVGKSRLTQALKDHIADQPYIQLACYSSPYAHNTALYPVIEMIEQYVGMQRDNPPEAQLTSLEQTLGEYGLASDEMVPLFAVLLSIPLPAGRYAPVQMISQRQRQQVRYQTLQAIVTFLLALTESRPLLLIIEDLHWTDPSTIELLGLLMDQAPMARLLIVVTCRPTFQPPWGLRSHLTPIAMQRLTRPQAEEMVQRLTAGKRLPDDVLRQIVDKSDGIPLFVEEITKAVLEAGWLSEHGDRYELTETFSSLAIPATLQDSLMARLDQLVTAKGVAQLGAVVGRQFSYALLRVVASLDDTTLQRELARLVEAELLYQRGLPPEATYVFKHALVQDIAYQSLLKRTRQAYHRQIAQVLEAQFPTTVETQPELLAHHYTEAGLSEHAIPCWQRAGEQAIQRSANTEAIRHLTRGLEVLETLPETSERARHELTLHLALGAPLTVTKGWGAPDVADVFSRARALCDQVGKPAQLFQALYGLWTFYEVAGPLPTSLEIGDELLRFAQSVQSPAFQLQAHRALGGTLFWLGDLVRAHTHLEQALALYNPQQHRDQAFRAGHDAGVACSSHIARTLWPLGYTVQALARNNEALSLAQQQTHAPSLTYAHTWSAMLYQLYREVEAVQNHAEQAVKLSREQGSAAYLAIGTALQGWALVLQGHDDEGLIQICQGLAGHRATGAQTITVYLLAVLADAYGRAGQISEGLNVVAEALALIDTNGERYAEAELYRLKGELMQNADGEWRTADFTPEACFQKALSIARNQHAKSWELRAATSLARLWQSQGKHQDAYDLLAPVYEWFTEGFNTTDLREAKALLDDLSEDQS